MPSPVLLSVVVVVCCAAALALNLRQLRRLRAEDRPAPAILWVTTVIVVAVAAFQVIAILTRAAG